MIKRRCGFTLLELMIAVLILVVGIVGILAVYIYCYNLIESSRNTTQATNDAKAVFEAMRDESTTSLMNVVYTNWTSWAQGTSSTASGKTNNTPLTSLTQENITTTITGTDPIQITVTVSWLDRGVRSRQISLVTLMTER